MGVSMFQGLFSISEADKNTAVESIIQHATPRKDFFLMLVLSISMAAFGVLLNSTVILVGSMLVAPLLYPLLSLSLGVIIADHKVISQSVVTITKSIIYGLIAGVVIGFFFSGHDPASMPLFTTIGDASSLMYAIVAVIAGLAGAFAVTKPHLTETIPGVAISVALVPPLSAAGIALALFDWRVFSSALLLFFVNVIGIVFSSMVVFALMRLSVKRTVAREAFKQEEKAIKQEEKPPEATHTAHV